MAILQQPLFEWLQAPEQLSMRRAFAAWFGRVFLPKSLPNVSRPPMGDLPEVCHWCRVTMEKGGSIIVVGRGFEN
ncbi:hypothetical protein Thiosp_03985 [Thiorhodovibrio litoralis]|nr:hypothetical protein Thiosp_03985 [Thiorhodovibrio litoralis]